MLHFRSVDLNKLGIVASHRVLRIRNLVAPLPFHTHRYGFGEWREDMKKLLSVSGRDGKQQASGHTPPHTFITA